MDKKYPCCEKHCSKDTLSCNRGKESFRKTNFLNIRNNIIQELRACGHFLHHNGKIVLNNFF